MAGKTKVKSLKTIWIFKCNSPQKTKYLSALVSRRTSGKEVKPCGSKSIPPVRQLSVVYPSLIHINIPPNNINGTIRSVVVPPSKSLTVGGVDLIWPESLT